MLQAGRRRLPAVTMISLTIKTLIIRIAEMNARLRRRKSRSLQTIRLVEVIKADMSAEEERPL